MKKLCIFISMFLFTCLIATFSSCSERPAAERDLVVEADGSVVINHASVPLPTLLSEEGKQVLMRTTPSEGPGAPVPLPSDISDMAELRRVYNENLQPRVDHMRAVFPVDIEETTIEGISAAIITPQGGVPPENRNRLFLNGPGGGFRTGVRGNGLLISIPVAAKLGVKVVSILYRQGPEYQFPAASEDLLKVWDHFTTTYKPENIGMVGCSAGGALIAQTTAILINEGRPTPGVLGVYCAGIPTMGSGDSRFMGRLTVTNVATAVVETSAPPPAREAAEGEAPAEPPRSYYTGVDRNQFIVTPTVNEELLSKFPPTIFFTGTRDMAMSGAAYSHRKLLKLGIESDLLIFDGLYHGFMTNPDFPEAQEGYEIAAKFFDKHLGR
jgi:acetyl esterase/lipase